MDDTPPPNVLKDSDFMGQMDRHQLQDQEQKEEWSSLESISHGAQCQSVRGWASGGGRSHSCVPPAPFPAMPGVGSPPASLQCFISPRPPSPHHGCPGGRYPGNRKAK